MKRLLIVKMQIVLLLLTMLLLSQNKMNKNERSAFTADVVAPYAVDALSLSNSQTFISQDNLAGTKPALDMLFSVGGNNTCLVLTKNRTARNLLTADVPYFVQHQECKETSPALIVGRMSLKQT